MLFRTIAFVILILFYGSYFLKMFVQKKQGIQTDQIGRGKIGLEKKIEYLMKIITVTIPIIQIITILFQRIFLPSPIRWFGMFIGCIGVIIFIFSIITMKDSWRAGVSKEEKTALITNGIYKFSRNPAFLGFDLVYLGIVCLCFSWSLLILSMIGIVVFHLQIVYVEERFLVQNFGQLYIKYMKQVRRYFGRKK